MGAHAEEHWGQQDGRGGLRSGCLEMVGVSDEKDPLQVKSWGSVRTDRR